MLRNSTKVYIGMASLFVDLFCLTSSALLKNHLIFYMPFKTFCPGHGGREWTFVYVPKAPHIRHVGDKQQNNSSAAPVYPIRLNLL